MDAEVSEQAISHIKLTLPKRIFEVCYLMKRETQVEFVGTDVAGDFTKQLYLVRGDLDHVSISLSVDNLTFEGNNLCFSVDKVQAKDENVVQQCLEEDVRKDSKAVARPGDTTQVKRKRGRPRKEDKAASLKAIEDEQSQTDLLEQGIMIIFVTQ